MTRREAIVRLAGRAAAFVGIFFFPSGRFPIRAWGKRVKKEAGMKLPKPSFDEGLSLEEAVRTRRTVRSFASIPLDLVELSRVLWAAQGITEEGGFKRAAPSAGALYPMDLYAVTGPDGVKGVPPGVYHYRPGIHSIVPVSEGDRREQVARAALSQMWMARAPVIFLVAAEYERVTVKYGTRGVRYAVIEAGHVGQNIFLQAGSLGLSAGIVGAFRDKKLGEAADLPKAHAPLLLMPVGHAA